MGSIWLIPALVVCAAQSAGQTARVEVDMLSGLHPRVFLTPGELEFVRARAETEPWARDVKHKLLAEADDLATESLDIPRKGGQWSHWYSCAKDGGRLSARAPTEHVCGVCGEVYSGWPYDDVYVASRHNHWLQGARTLGLAYGLTGAERYVSRLREILLEYASFYQSLPLHDIHNKQGSAKARLNAQTLDEAVSLCAIALGYDFAYDAACFSAGDHAFIADGLIRPMVATIRANDRGVSNWQTWHNAAVGVAGLVLGDRELVDWAINGKSGFMFQMNKSVMDSGMWYEESPVYHWYALNANLYLLESAARAGADLYSLPKVKKMFDAPARQLLPDLTYVPFHDSDRASIRDARYFYDVAFARYQDAAYLALIEPRDSWQALLWGAADAPAGSVGLPHLTSSNEPSEGLAILRDAANETVLFLDYGPGASGHNQPAKLNIVLYAFGDIRFDDAGRMPYGNPMHRAWFTQTLAHNTIVVDERSQRRAPGELVAFAATDEFGLIRARCATAYNGVTLDRTVCMRGPVIVDIVQCRSGTARTYDLPLHVRGEFSGLPGAKPLGRLSNSAAYREVKNPARLSAPVQRFFIQAGDGVITVECLDESEAFTGEGPGPGMREDIPMLLRRQKGRNARFITVYGIGAGESVLAKLHRNGAVTAADITVAADKTTRVTINDVTCLIGRDGMVNP